MSNRLNRSCWVLGVLFATVLASLGGAQAGTENAMKVDWQGDARWSKYNFTDLINPYEEFDMWTELKAAYFLDQEMNTFAPYVSVLGVWSTAANDRPSPGAFDWQRNAEARLGLQWFPLADNGEWLQALRFYGYYATRVYASDTLDLEKTDSRWGVDYYHDNLPAADPLVVLAYANCAYRKTNFSLDNYEAVLTEFNIKVGPRVGNLPIMIRSQLVPYVLLEGAYVSKYEERWWENYLRAGGGIRLYVDPGRDGKDFWNKFFQRFNVYAEYVRNVSWLGDDPKDLGSEVSPYDVRLGFSFATGGFFNE
jgi:hypothetical protein